MFSRGGLISSLRENIREENREVVVKRIKRYLLSGFLVEDGHISLLALKMTQV
jgi:hypothetical protein